MQDDFCTQKKRKKKIYRGTKKKPILSLVLPCKGKKKKYLSLRYKKDGGAPGSEVLIPSSEGVAGMNRS